MDWRWLLLGAVVVTYFAWQQSKNKRKSEVATERLRKDNELYQHIKTGMREFDWRRNQDFKAYLNLADRQVIFETAHMQAFFVEHYAEYRVGFYFKDLNEYGLYGSFTGNNDDHYESYYRTDRTFQKEEALLYE